MTSLPMTSRPTVHLWSLRVVLSLTVTVWTSLAVVALLVSWPRNAAAKLSLRITASILRLSEKSLEPTLPPPGGQDPPFLGAGL